MLKVQNFNVCLSCHITQKVIWNWFCTPKIFKNTIKLDFSIRNILSTICVGRDWIVKEYFLLEKQAFGGLLKVIGIQIKCVVQYEWKKTTSRLDKYIINHILQ